MYCCDSISYPGQVGAKSSIGSSNSENKTVGLTLLGPEAFLKQKRSSTYFREKEIGHRERKRLGLVWRFLLLGESCQVRFG